MQKEEQYLFNLNNLDLPKIKQRSEIKSNNNSYKVSKTNPNLKRRLEEYKLKFNFILPKLNTNTPRYYQIINSENLKELAKNNIQSNKNIFSYIKEKGEIYQQKLKEKLEIKEPKNSYGSKIKNMLRLHSSKYHPEEDIKKHQLDDFDKMLNKLKYGSYNYINDDDREIKYRQRLAFKYRFLKNGKNLHPINFEKMNSKMNQLLSISKSIPNYLLIQKNKTKSKQEEKKEEINIKTESINNSDNFSSIHSKKRIKYKSFDFPIKIKRQTEESLKLHNNTSNIIIYNKNGKKFIHHLSLIL